MTFAATTGTTSAAPSQTAFAPGRAAAVAQTYKIDPRAANLSLGITGGVSLAEYQNLRGIGEARSLDLGIIGQLLAAPGCDGGDPTLSADKQPQALHVESTDSTGGARQTQQDDKLVAATKTAEAGESFGYAKVETGPVVIPGVIEIGGGWSETITRTVEGGYREAVATTFISKVNIGGLITLGGLKWEAIHRTGSESKVTGTFSAASATETLLGKLGLDAVLKELPLKELPLDPAQLIAALNSITEAAKLGIVIHQPEVREAAGIIFVEPMSIAIEPSTFRDSLLGKLLVNVAPTYEELKRELFKISCKTEDVATVLDVTINALSGAGLFSVQLGGAQATSAEIIKRCTLRCPGEGGGLGGGGLGGGGLGGGGGTGTTGGGIQSTPRPATPTSTQASAPQPQVAAPATTTTPSQPISAKGKRGGALAGVGLAGLALLGLMAEGDRRKMRKAQRMIPLGV